MIGLNASGSLDVEQPGRAPADDPASVVINHTSNVAGRANDVGPLPAKPNTTPPDRPASPPSSHTRRKESSAATRTASPFVIRTA